MFLKWHFSKHTPYSVPVSLNLTAILTDIIACIGTPSLQNSMTSSNPRRQAAAMPGHPRLECLLTVRLRAPLRRVLRLALQVAEMSELPFYPDQISLLMRTGVLMGVHGAGLANQVFMKPRLGAVVEVRQAHKTALT